MFKKRLWLLKSTFPPIKFKVLQSALIFQLIGQGGIVWGKKQQHTLLNTRKKIHGKNKLVAPEKGITH
jgi:hypothetical protein